MKEQKRKEKEGVKELEGENEEVPTTPAMV
jgi:hypothetical protein